MAHAERDRWGEFLVTLSVAEVESLLVACREHGFASINGLLVDDVLDVDGPLMRVSVIFRSQAEQDTPEVSNF